MCVTLRGLGSHERPLSVTHAEPRSAAETGPQGPSLPRRIFSLARISVRHADRCGRTIRAKRISATRDRPRHRQTLFTFQSTMRWQNRPRTTWPCRPGSQELHRSGSKRLVEADGIEPTTPCLQSRCSPTELRPRTQPACHTAQLQVQSLA